MIREKTRFFTDDGKEFDNLSAAADHEEALKLALELLEEFGRIVISSEWEDVAAWLMKHYTLTPKAEG